MLMQARLPPVRRSGIQTAGVESRLKPSRQDAVAEESPSVAVKEMGARLKAARKKKKITQEAVGAYCDLTSHSSVGQWERGEVFLETINLILYAQKTGESLDWLVFGMKGSIERRLDQLPDSLRELALEQITSALESAERAQKRHPKLFTAEYVPDADPRLTTWSAKDKPRRAQVANRKRKK